MYLSGQTSRDFQTHEDAACAVVALIPDNPQMYMAVICPTIRIGHYVRDCLLEEATKHSLKFTIHKSKYLVTFGNGARVEFFSVLMSDCLRGLLFDAVWVVAREIMPMRSEHLIMAMLENRTHKGIIEHGLLESFG